MPQDFERERERLRAWGVRPVRSLGQHFLFNPRLLEYIVESAAVAPGDLVLEVGPGTGALTRRLLARGARVTAVEIDRRLARHLVGELGGNPAFRLIEGDVLAGKRALSPAVTAAIAEAGGPVKLVANLPFGTATPLLVMLLEEVETLAVAVATVQLEVAARFASAPGGKDYGAISVLSQNLARVEKLRRIPSAAFVPPPRVDAAVVRFTPAPERRPDRRLYRSLRDLVEWAFGQRRKSLSGRLQARFPGTEFATLLPAGIRPEGVTAEGFLELARRLLASGADLGMGRRAGPRVRGRRDRG